MIEEQAVQEALHEVYDPELGLDVVNLGLVYDVKVEGEKVAVTMTLTTQGCPLHDSIVRGAEARLRRVPGVKEAQVSLVWEPAWTPDRLSPEARKQLGYPT